MIAVASVAAALLSGCGARDAAADSSQISQYVASGAASNAPPPANSDGDAPKCFTAADVKTAMGIDVVDLTNGMQKFGEFWNCGYVPANATTTPGVSVQLTVASASEADATFDRHIRSMRIARGPGAQPDPLQLGDRGMAYDTPSGAVAMTVSGNQLYIVETMYGTAGQNFTDKKEGTIALLRKSIP
jgi:hypothetical protein